MKCEFCEKDLLFKNRRFCSLSCSNKARPSRKKYFLNECQQCKKEFTVDSGSKKNKFCSKSCSATFNNLGKRRSKKEIRFCIICDEVLGIKNNSKYCTTKCRHVDEIKRWLSGELDGSWKYTHASYVRRFLEEKSGGRCEICSFDTKRKNGASILQVDHIDGNWRNNRPENVRLLCPNCHCLTDTWGAGNMGKGRTWKQNYNQYGEK